MIQEGGAIVKVYAKCIAILAQPCFHGYWLVLQFGGHKHPNSYTPMLLTWAIEWNTQKPIHIMGGVNYVM